MDDRHIQTRIMWKLRKSLPALAELLDYDVHAQEAPDLLREVVTAGQVGVPILLFLGPKGEWTVLGTQAIARQEGDGTTIIPIQNIKSFAPVIGGEQTKLSFEYHVLEDVDGHSHYWWTPSGTSIALRGAMDMLRRMTKPTLS